MAQTRIAVAARKGGVGKTSIACGLGSVMASQGKRVLVIDSARSPMPPTY